MLGGGPIIKGLILTTSLFAAHLLFQLGTAYRPLPSPLCDKFPELVAAPQLQLLFVHSFDANNERNWLAVTRDDHTLVLGFLDASIQIGLFDTNHFHMLPQCYTC
jgi:hypothetical protein